MKTGLKVQTTVSLLLLTTALTACDLAPKLHMPSFGSVPPYKEAALSPEDAGTWQTGEPAAAQPRGEWWRVFNDETLNGLEDEAAKNNQNLAAIAARVQQARSTARIAGAALLPQINNATGARREKLNAAAFGQPASTSLPVVNDVSSIFTLDYELDFFGGLRNTKKAAKQDAESAEAQLQSARLALQADVADMYFSLQSLDSEIEILKRGVQIRTDSLDILKKRVNVGNITELDVSTSVVDLETTRSQLESAQQDRQSTEHALAVLLGKAPSEFNFEHAKLTAKVPTIPPGLPSGLLQRRPDITAAQHDLIAANARIGVAKAAFFPRIALTGSGGWESNTLSDLFKWDSRSWSLGPTMSLPIFQGGRNVANLGRSRAAFDEAVATYRERVLESFRDVEDSLTALKTLEAQSRSQVVSADAAKQAEKIANLRYDSGDLGYLETISARRDALDTERLGVQIHRARLTATILLIRALGGGWDAAPAAATPAPLAATAPAVTPAPAAPAVVTQTQTQTQTTTTETKVVPHAVAPAPVPRGTLNP